MSLADEALSLLRISNYELILVLTINDDNKIKTNFERGEHDAEFSVLKMRLHEVVNEVNLSGQMLDTRPDDDELEQWKQVIHAPLIFAAKVPLHNLATSIPRCLQFTENLYMQQFNGTQSTNITIINSITAISG